MSILKIITLATWALIAAAFLGFVPREYASWLTLIGAVLLVAHLAEYFIFNKKISAKGDGGFKAFAMTIVFGVFYINNL